MSTRSTVARIATLFALSACALLEPLKPTEQTAVIKPGQWGKVYRGGYVEIVSVSGVEPAWHLHSALAVPVGDRSAVFSVDLCNGGPWDCVSIVETRVAFRAEGGHTYIPRAREQVNGSNRFWVWVEDLGTGRAVGGTVPGTPES
jgi:hypothetical protein